MSRSYPAFGNVKTLTLPIPDSNGLTIAQYKEKYGIDLKDILFISEIDGGMHLLYNGLILLSDIDNSLWNGFNAYGEYSTFPVSAYSYSIYESENSNGLLSIGYLNSSDGMVTGINFLLPKDRPVSYDNIIVQACGN